MKMTRLLTLAGALVAAGAALPGTAEMPLGEGITHYYDFEQNMATKVGDDDFVLTGRTWNAESFCLAINPGINIKLKGTGIDVVKPPKVPYTFGGALSGSNKKAAFYKTDAGHLCPSGECWTIAFWALRSKLTDNAPKLLSMPLLLVNGTPILRDNLTRENLEAENTQTNDGFGFYVFRENMPENLKFKVGVRLSEKKNNNTYRIRSIISNSPFEWYATRQVRWHNIMLVRNDTEITLYVDGLLQGGTNMVAGSFIQAPANGFFYTSFNNSGQGDENALDDLAIWNRTLTPAEIAGIAAGDKPISQMGNGVKAGLTHYYDFETNRVSKASKNNNIWTFDVTGQVWNAGQEVIEENPDITLVSRCAANGGIGTASLKKTGFGEAYSGGGKVGNQNMNARFFQSDAPFLCPTGAHWTISFWAMRGVNKDNKLANPLILVNGARFPSSPNKIDGYTIEGLQEVSDKNQGFGFYTFTDANSNGWGKVGVRLSQLTVNDTTTNSEIRSIVSEDLFPWKTDADTSQIGLWHHVMLVRDHTALTLYVDGRAEGDTTMEAGSSVEVPEKNGLFSTHVAANKVRLMMFPENGLDDLTIWSRALNPGEREAVALGAAPVSLMAATPCRTMILIK